MHNPASILVPWSSYYVIIGSSAGALTGLVFVVITLVTGGRLRVTAQIQVQGDRYPAHLQSRVGC